MRMDMDDSYINIAPRDRNRSIYRIISLDRMYELFEKRLNTLVKPLKWDDPFENFISTLKGRLPSGEIVEFAQRFEFYGQCWTLVPASDAMWRIYSSDRKSVRIRVKIEKLLRQIYEYAIGAVFIGRVRYLTGDGLVKWARRVFREAETPTIRLLARTLLVKRTAFSHENEVRLLYLAAVRDTDVIYRHPFDPHRCIEEIVIDPRVPEEEAERLKAEINIVPFTDVLLVLLIIFMVTTPLIIQGQIQVKLPKASSQAPLEMKPVVLTLTSLGKLYLNDGEISFQDLPALLSGALKGREDKTVVINADKSSAHGKVVTLLDAAKAAGANKLAIATENGCI